MSYKYNNCGKYGLHPDTYSVARALYKLNEIVNRNPMRGDHKILINTNGNKKSDGLYPLNLADCRGLDDLQLYDTPQGVFVILSFDDNSYEIGTKERIKMTNLDKYKERPYPIDSDTLSSMTIKDSSDLIEHIHTVSKQHAEELKIHSDNLIKITEYFKSNFDSIS